jgi:prepilin-type processing-associated H-X9-DG protein
MVTPRARWGLPGREPSCAAGLTLVELLVVVGVIGLLVGLLLPAVQSARAAGRAAACRHGLRQVGMATLAFHDAFSAFPPARLAAGSEDRPEPVPGITWLVRVAAFLDATDLASSWDPAVPWPDQPAALRENVVPTYLCPARRGQGNAVVPSGRMPSFVAPCGCMFEGRQVIGGAATDFGGNHGDLSPSADGSATDFYRGGNGSGVIITSRDLPGTARWRDRVRHRDLLDGSSRTLLAGELHVRRGMLNRTPDNPPAFDGSAFHHMSRVGGAGAPIASGPDDEVAGMAPYVFGSWHPGGCHFVFADGHGSTLSPDIDPAVLGRLCNRHDEASDDRP